MFSILKLYKLNTDDVRDIARSVMTVIQKHLIDDSYLARQIAKMSTANQDLELLRARVMVNSLTDDLREIDLERDNIIEAIETKVDSVALLKKYDQERGESAEAILRAFKAKPISIHAGYNIESNQIRDRIQHCASEELQDHFEVVNIENLWEILITLQDRFEVITAEKSRQESVKLRGTVKEQTERIKDLLKYILPYMESQAIDLQGAYDIAAKEMLEQLTRVMSIAGARSTRRKSDDTE